MGAIEEHVARIAELRSRQAELDKEYEGQAFPEAARNEFRDNREEITRLGNLVDELRFRQDEVASGADDDDKRDDDRVGFQSRRPSAVTGEDIYDLSTVRARYDEPAQMKRELTDRAMRSVEGASFPSLGVLASKRADEARSNPTGAAPAPTPDNSAVKAHIERLLRDTREAIPGEVARRILQTGSPLYRAAFGKTVLGRVLNPDEQRALALGAGGTGGFAVVYTLDPTLVPTSNFSVNPFRALARIETISGTNEWKALTSGAITAAYAAEATEASDNAPTLAQPDIIAEKAQAFVPFSIEAGQDWEGLQAEMGGLFQDAKDDLEATKFALGAGHGSFEPKGIITAATVTTAAGGTAAFAIADLYKVFEALPARFRPRAQWAANLFTFDKVRQFDTAGGSGVWKEPNGLGGGVGGVAVGAVGASGVPQILGRNAWESTAMDAALTTGSKIAVIGDWRYFVIVDRIGMDVELIPNLVGTNRRPTGQRGLYAYWRNSSDVLSTAAFRVLVTG